MKRIFAILAVVAGIIMVASCDRYEDGRPAKDTIREFESMYPDAWDVEWEYDGLYWEVNFETGKRPNGTDHTAWYDMSGNWLKTKTEVAYSAVPKDIIGYFEASEYGNRQMEDHFIDFYETPAGNFYRFEIYLDGRETGVDVTEDGKVSLAGYDY